MVLGQKVEHMQGQACHGGTKIGLGKLKHGHDRSFRGTYRASRASTCSWIPVCFMTVFDRPAFNLCLPSYLHCLLGLLRDRWYRCRTSVQNPIPNRHGTQIWRISICAALLTTSSIVKTWEIGTRDVKYASCHCVTVIDVTAQHKGDDCKKWI